MEAGAGIGSEDSDDGGGAGGGATDIRLIPGDWDNFDSLKSRIMVAGGGSGGAVVDRGFSGKAGGSGGGLTATGSIWKYPNIQVSNHTYNATQKTGYKFGIGQDGVTKGNAGGAGAGGGYYGGYSSTDNTAGGAGGGSGFISGYEGCDAISKDSTENNIIHTGQSIHYSGKFFINSTLLDGNSDTPTKTNYKVEKGNSGDGHVKITFLGNMIEDSNSIKEFKYTGSYQEFQATETAYYKIECYGASGGNSYAYDKYYANEGTGGYASGIIKLVKDEKIYLYVGQQGDKGIGTKDEITKKSFNGGRCR